MKITQEVDYALRVVLYLCKLGYDERIEARVMSESEKIPSRFLMKLLRKLTKAGIIKSFRGINGGYSLNKLPGDITLRQVVEAIEGPIYVSRCITEPECCNLNRTSTCPVHKALGSVQQVMLKELERLNFEDIMKGDI